MEEEVNTTAAVLPTVCASGKIKDLDSVSPDLVASKGDLLVSFENKYSTDSNFLPRIPITHLEHDIDWQTCDDNIKIEAFNPSTMVFAGRQRKGGAQLVDETEDPSLHIHIAMDLGTPFSAAISLPSDVSGVIDVVKAVSNEQMVDFWQRRLGAIKSIKQSIKNENGERYESTPSVIRNATGVIDIPLWSYLIRAFDLRNPLWMSQFASGFPIVGPLSQNRLYATKSISAEVVDSAGSIDNLFIADGKRFRERAFPSNLKRAQTLRAESCDRRDLGFLGPPGKLSPCGTFIDCPGKVVNICFRFPLDQREKIRDIDDFRQAEINKYCFIDTPISLPSWGHIAKNV